MIVKRGAFLLLTSALAHQACVVEKTDGNGSGGTGGTGTGGGKATGGKGGDGGSSTGGRGGSSGSAQAGDTGESGAGGAAGEGATGPSGGTAGSSGTGQTAGGEGGEAQGGEGGAPPSCDDGVGTLGDCTAFDETDCSWERGYCTSAGTYLKPKIADAASDCMLADPACLTSGIDPYGCVRQALAGACRVAENDAFCAEAVSACSPNESIDADGCHALVDGLTDSGLLLVASCVDDGCTFGLWSCVEGVQ